MKSKTSIKISDNAIEFLRKFRTNRRKVEIDKEDLSYWQLLEVIATYFKLENESYLKLINMEFKNVRIFR